MTSYERMVACKARGPLYSDGKRVASRFDSKHTATASDPRWLAVGGDVFPCWTYVITWDHDSDCSDRRYREGYLQPLV